MMYKMLRNHGTLKKGSEIKLMGKQADLFVENGFAELLEDNKKECVDCEDKPCTDCEEHAKKKKATPRKKATTKK